MTFQTIALFLVVLFSLAVLFLTRRSNVVLVGGLLLIGLFTLISFLTGRVGPAELGLAAPRPWLLTLAFALGGLVVAVAYSPLADRLASRLVEEPPRLQAFGAIQQSLLKLIAGILIAWLLGGFLEELIARGIVLNSLRSLLGGGWFAVTVALLTAAAGAGLMHRYQGRRAMLIITQLSILFGLLFVLSGYNLWAVIICHGLYDTIGFIRFALKKSRYSDPAKSQS